MKVYKECIITQEQSIDSFCKDYRIDKSSFHKTMLTSYGMTNEVECAFVRLEDIFKTEYEDVTILNFIFFKEENVAFCRLQRNFNGTTDEKVKNKIIQLYSNNINNNKSKNEIKSDKAKLTTEPTFINEYNKYRYRDVDLENDEYLLESRKAESWNKTFMEIAKVAAKRSKDPHTKVGACLVQKGRVIGIGYNGTPKHFSLNFDWNSSEKYKYVVHAEMNALTNACSIGVSCVGADIYVTMSPCKDCIKLLIQHEVGTIFFLEKYKDYDEMIEIANNCGLKVIQLKEDL